MISSFYLIEGGKMKNNNYTWYVEPKNDATNSIISQNLPAEEALEGIIDNLGHKHNAWRCSFKFIQMLRRMKSGNPNVSFDVLNQRGREQIRKFNPRLF